MMSLRLQRFLLLCSVALFFAPAVPADESSAEAAVTLHVEAAAVPRGQNLIIDVRFDPLRARGERQPDLIFLQILSDPNTLLPAPEGAAERVWLPIENAPNSLGALAFARHVMPSGELAAGRYSLRLMCVLGENESFSDVTTFEVVEP